MELIRELLAHHAAGTTQLADDVLVLPAEVYTSESHWQVEREALFRRRPVVACLSGAVASVGDYVSLTVGGVPVVVVRGDDGVLRGFRNVCRHRASSVLSGCGSGAASLRCPFHAWTYRLDGSLLARPQAGEGFAGTDESDLGLVPVPVEEANGLVLVRAEGDESVDAPGLVGDAAQDLSDFGVGGYVPFDRWESSWPCNWKLLVDTFLESYHVFSLHRSTVGRYYLSQPMTYRGYGPNLRFQTCQKSILDLAEAPEDEWDLLSRATVEYLIAPNTILSHSVDHFAVYQFLAHRGRPHRRDHDPLHPRARHRPNPPPLRTHPGTPPEGRRRRGFSPSREDPAIPLLRPDHRNPGRPPRSRPHPLPPSPE